jgi:hypothetical protein
MISTSCLRISATALLVAIVSGCAETVAPPPTPAPEPPPVLDIVRGVPVTPARAYEFLDDTIVVRVRQSGVRRGTYLVVSVAHPGVAEWSFRGTPQTTRTSAAVFSDSLRPDEFRLRWRLGGQRTQRLSISVIFSKRSETDSLVPPPLSAAFDVTLDAPASTVSADEVIATGTWSSCWRDATAVACTGRDATSVGDTVNIASSVRAVPLQFDEPVVRLVPVGAGPSPAAGCAVHASGRTSCWVGLGPRNGMVPIDTGHPPLTRVRGAVAVDAAGAVWHAMRISDRTRPGVTDVVQWQRLRSDSVFVDALDAISATTSPRCGITRSGALVCQYADRVALENAVTVPLLTDSGRVVVRGGFSDVRGVTGEETVLGLRDEADRIWSLPVWRYSTTGWNASPRREPVGSATPCLRTSYPTHVTTADAALCSDSANTGVFRLGLIGGSAGHAFGAVRTCFPGRVVVCPTTWIDAGIQSRRSVSVVDTLSVLR